jgi:hypothetical protein
MTYPQQGFGQPNPYAQPAQYGSQVYQQQFQSGQPVSGQGFNPAPQQQAQQAPTGHQAAPSFDNAEDPSGGGGLFARPRHLEGRTVVYIPKRADQNAKGMDGNPKSTPNVYGSLIVVDGPSPLAFGDKQESGGRVVRPNTHSVSVPAYFPDVIVGEQEVSKALMKAVPPFGNGLMVGVIVRGTQGNRPYLLQVLEGNDPRRAQARAVYEAWRAGQWTPPEFVEIAPTPGSAAQQQPPQTPGQPAQWSAPQTMGGQVQQWQPQQPAQGVAAAVGAPGAQWGQSQGFGGQPAAQPAQQPAQDFGQGGFGSEPWRQPAPGWSPENWAALPDVNKQQVWAMVQQQQAAPPQPGNMGTPTGF